MHTELVTQGKINFLLNVGCRYFCCCCCHTYNMWHKSMEYATMISTRSTCCWQQYFPNNKQQTAESLSSNSARSSNSITTEFERKTKTKWKINRKWWVQIAFNSTYISTWNESGVCVTVCAFQCEYICSKTVSGFLSNNCLVSMFFRFPLLLLPTRCGIKGWTA